MSKVHRYYRITKFYSFLKQIAIKGAITIGIVVLVLMGLEYFFIDINGLLDTMVSTYPAWAIFAFFLVSETILGLVPPEIFIAWSAKATNPLLYLFIISLMSYLGGVISYFLGVYTGKIPKIKDNLENKVAIHVVNLRKWGGVLVFIGAMLPLPHAVVSFTCGLIKYNFGNYLLWALFRFLRFAIYAWVLFSIF
ncbi:MAG: VTT domain-containing protein [Bacteroidales bacterium]|nr:VTT domain-containing protein [Bacteroidales bacterium]